MNREVRNKMVVQTYSISKLLKSCSDEVALKYVKKRHFKVTCNTVFLSLLCKHIQEVLKHRRWIIRMFFFVSHALIQEQREKLYERILQHDLSKLSSIESIGYTIQFHRKGKEKNEKEKKCVEKAFKHHYECNDHHPEYYGANNMDEYALIESIIDMLACRTDRDISRDNFTLSAILDIPDIYLERYTVGDKKKVCKYLNEWKHVLKEGIYMNYLIKEIEREEINNAKE